MTRDKALKKLIANLWGAVITPRGPMMVNMSEAFLMERDKDFPMDHFTIMISLEGSEAFEVAKALSPERKTIATPSGQTHIVPVDEDEIELEDDGPKIVIQ